MRGDRTLDTEEIPCILVPEPKHERDDKQGMDEIDEKPGMEYILSMPGSEPTTGMASRVLSRFMNPPMGIAGKPEARPPMELMPGIAALHNPSPAARRRSGPARRETAGRRPADPISARGPGGRRGARR